MHFSRPNRNFTVTRKEPIGVVGLVTPWNYPLMMLSWKASKTGKKDNKFVRMFIKITKLSESIVDKHRIIYCACNIFMIWRVFHLNLSPSIK